MQASGFLMDKLGTGGAHNLLDLKDSDKEEECTQYIDQKYVAYIL